MAKNKRNRPPQPHRRDRSLPRPPPGAVPVTGLERHVIHVPIFRKVLHESPPVVNAGPYYVNSTPISRPWMPES